MLNKIKIALAEALGFIVLLPACLLHAWTPTAVYPSIKPIPIGAVGIRRYVDVWKWNWLNYWYANSEDGVSGLDAVIWVDGKLTWYYDTFQPWVPRWARAYAWSAWRNGANNLKRPLRTDGNNVPWKPQS
jgi:hypothetical protein